MPPRRPAPATVDAGRPCWTLTTTTAAPDRRRRATVPSPASLAPGLAGRPVWPTRWTAVSIRSPRCPPAPDPRSGDRPEAGPAHDPDDSFSGTRRRSVTCWPRSGPVGPTTGPGRSGRRSGGPRRWRRLHVAGSRTIGCTITTSSRRSIGSPCPDGDTEDLLSEFVLDALARRGGPAVTPPLVAEVVVSPPGSGTWTIYRGRRVRQPATADAVGRDRLGERGAGPLPGRARRCRSRRPRRAHGRRDPVACGVPVAVRPGPTVDLHGDDRVHGPVAPAWPRR